MAVSFLTGGGGNFTPIVKYDARMGTFSLRVRNEVTQEWEDEKIDPGFSAIWDLENFEIGWAQYSMTGGPPSFAMVHNKSAPPPQPTPDHKRNVRILLKMPKSLGGEIRELSSSTGVFREGFNALHSAYTEQLPGNEGKLPVVKMTKTVNKALKGSTNKNHVPVFTIEKWVPRPDDLVAPGQSGSDYDDDEPAPVKTSPASTGSTKVKAPAVDDEDDFG